MQFERCKNCSTKFQKKYRTQTFCSLRCSNRYNLNGLNKVTIPKHCRALAEFIGIILGDGNVSKYFTCISLNAVADADYIPYVMDLSKQLFPGAPVTVTYRPECHLARIQISSRIVADYLRSMGMIPYKKTVPHWIFKNTTYRRACVRGLFDTEGSISFKLYRSRKGMRVYKQLNFRNADQPLMQFVRDTLRELQLQPTATLRRSLYLSNDTAIAHY